MRKRSKPKTVSYELLTRDSVIGHPMYALLDPRIHVGFPTKRPR